MLSETQLTFVQSATGVTSYPTVLLPQFSLQAMLTFQGRTQQTCQTNKERATMHLVYV